MAHKFEIYKDKAGEFRVRFKYNAETIFSTEGYKSKSSAQNAIDSIKKCQTAFKTDPRSASNIDPSSLCSRTGGEARSGQLAQRVAA